MTWSLADAVRVVGGYVWWEERLFETLGAWVPEVAEPEAKLRLAADSHHHAWHASLWRQRLPALAGMDVEALVAPPPAAGGAGLEAFLAELDASPATIDKLVGVYRVALPHQVATYQRHLERASEITDGPTIRALHLVLADDRADCHDGEALIQRLLGSGGGGPRAAAHQARLEAHLVGGGGGRESNPPDGDHPSQPL